MSLWVAGATVVAGVGGAAIGANSSKKAQAGANAANQYAIDSQNQAAYENWLASRGVSPGTPGLGPEGSAINTSLPIWATINGQPAEQALLNAILGGVGPNPNDPTAYGSVQQIEKFFNTPQGQQTLAEITANMAGSDDTRSPAQWLADHIQTTERGNGTFSTLLRDYANQPAGTDGSLLNAAAQVPPEIQALQNAVLQNAQGVFNGSIRQEELDALAPVLQANTDLAALQGQRNAEMRQGSTNILNTENQGLADLLAARQAGIGSIYDDAVRVAGDVYGARTSAADELYGAASQAARDLYSAREGGANRIYDADLRYADTYREASQQALQRILAQQTARNAVKGFAGESSGDALLRARTLAGGYQQSAGVRAQAGQSLAQSLAKAAEMQAMDLGSASTTRANSRGLAGVSRAQDLGTASQSKFTGLASAGEQNAIGRMNAAVANATRQAGILDADAAIANQQAALNNATAVAGITSNDIARRLNSGSLPSQLYGDQLALNTAAQGSQFGQLDAVLQRLSAFRSGNSTPPTPTAVQQQPGITSGQIWGSALGSAAQGIGGYLQNQQLIAALNRQPTASTGNTGLLNTASLWQGSGASGGFNSGLT